MREIVRFTIPWIPTSKKNQARAVVRKHGPRAGLPCVVPSHGSAADQEAIHALAVAAITGNRGLPTYAKARLVAGNGVGTKTLGDMVRVALLGKGAKLPRLEDRDVRLDIRIHYSRKAGGDYVEVAVLDLGERVERKRSGRKRDAINVPAIIADALNGVLYPDDRDVVELLLRVDHEDRPHRKTGPREGSLSSEH